MKFPRILAIVLAANACLITQALEIGGIKMDLRQEIITATTRKGYEQYSENGEKKLRPYDYINFATEQFKRTLNCRPGGFRVGWIFDGHELSYQNHSHVNAAAVCVNGKFVGSGKDATAHFTFSGGERGCANFVWRDPEVANVDAVYSVFPADPIAYLHLAINPVMEDASVVIVLNMNVNGICVKDREPMIIEGDNNTVQCQQNQGRNNIFPGENSTGSLLVKRPGTAKINKWSGAAGFVFEKNKVSAIDQIGYGTIRLKIKPGVQEFNLAFVDFYRPDEFTEEISQEYSRSFKEKIPHIHAVFSSGKHQ